MAELHYALQPFFATDVMSYGETAFERFGRIGREYSKEKGLPHRGWPCWPVTVNPLGSNAQRPHSEHLSVYMNGLKWTTRHRFEKHIASLRLSGLTRFGKPKGQQLV